MFCSECGINIQPGAKFCSSCGQAVATQEAVRNQTTSTTSKSNKVPVIEVKPVFVPMVIMLNIAPLILFFTVWGAAFFGGIAGALIDHLDLDIPYWLPAGIIAIGVFVFGPLVVYGLKKRSYDETNYRFYTDRLEYAEGFLTVEKKTVKFDNVTDSFLQRNFIQKPFGLGNIRLGTASGAGVLVKDIDNPEEVYAEVLKLIQ